MTDGANVSLRSTVRIWLEDPLFVEWCMEAATILAESMQSIAPITLRFYNDGVLSRVGAEMACQNKVFGILMPLERAMGGTSPHPIIVAVKIHPTGAPRLAQTKSDLLNLLGECLISKSYELELKGEVVQKLVANKVKGEG